MNDLEKGLDQCPACNGTGKHTLKAPGGKNYVLLRLYNREVFENFETIFYEATQPVTERSLDEACKLAQAFVVQRINQMLAEGYEIASIEENKWHLVWRHL